MRQLHDDDDDDDLTAYFQEGYDKGHCFQCKDYTFVQENWGYEHIPTKITVWADVLDLRTGEDAERDAGSVYYHYTNHLAYLNITNEAKENVELFASLNTDVERKNANAWWGKGIYTVPKAPHEWKAPPEEPHWSAIDTLLDNNYRSMMARDSRDYHEGMVAVKEKYTPRAQFCIPVLVNSWMVYDVSKERTPEMVQQRKEVGVNLADGLLNEDGRPRRVCVVIRNQTAAERHETITLRPPLEQKRLDGRSSLLKRVKKRLDALQQRHEEKESSGTTHELVQAQWRLGQVYAQQGQPKEAERLLLKVFSQRYGEEGLQHPDSLQALIDHAVSLQQMGHFAIAQDQLVRCLRFTSASPELTNNHKLQAQHFECLCQLGRLHMQHHNMRHAETLLIQAYTGRNRLFGDNHFKTLDSLQDLATVFRSLLNHKDAELCSRKALQGFEALLGKAHPASLDSRLVLAETLVILNNFEDAMKLYEGEDGLGAEMAKQLGRQHPKTRNAEVSLIKASCQQGDLSKAYQLWLKKAKSTGVVSNSGLLFDLLFRYASHKGFSGILLMTFMGIGACIPLALPTLRVAGIVTWPWTTAIAPLWIFQSTLLLAITTARRTGASQAEADKKEDKKDAVEKAAMDHGRELDDLSAEATVALLFCSVLLAVRLDVAPIPPFGVGAPWLLLELFWMFVEWRASGLWGLCPPWHAVLRVASVFWLAAWADGQLPSWLPWFTVISPAMLMLFISLVRLAIPLCKIGAGPVVSCTAISRSVDLQRDVCRAFTAIIYSAILVSFLYASEVEVHLILALPSVGLALMPSTALLALKFNCFIQWLFSEELRLSRARAR